MNNFFVQHRCNQINDLVKCLPKARISVSTEVKWRIHWPVTLHGHTAGFIWLWYLHLKWTETKHEGNL